MKRLPSLLEGTNSQNNSTLSYNPKAAHLRELSAKDGFLLARVGRDESSRHGKSTQDSARNAQSDDNRVKGQVRYVQKKDSIIDPDIHENFYPEGSL